MKIPIAVSLIFFSLCLKAQIHSDYQLKKLLDNTLPFQSITFAGIDSAFYYLHQNEKNSKIIKFDPAKSAEYDYYTTEDQLNSFAVVPKNGGLLLLPSEKAPYYLNDSRKSVFRKLAQREINAKEAVFNHSGNLLAIIEMNPASGERQLMTYDLKYDNLNKQFQVKGNISNLRWSGKSEFLSLTVADTGNYSSDILIVSWDARPKAYIHSDTIRLSETEWGGFSGRFLCSGKAASGHYLLLMKTDGTLVETVAFTTYPIKNILWTENGKKIYFSVEVNPNFYVFWFLDYSSLKE